MANVDVASEIMVSEVIPFRAYMIGYGITDIKTKSLRRSTAQDRLLFVTRARGIAVIMAKNLRRGCPSYARIMKHFLCLPFTSEGLMCNGAQSPTLSEWNTPSDSQSH